jgi:hypothetical protein
VNSAYNDKKRRLHIVLSLDNPVQQETWQLLSQAKNKTAAVCEAVCGYHKQKELEDTLRSILQDELKHIPVASAPQPVESDKEPEATADAAVLHFLQSLQNDEWG